MRGVLILGLLVSVILINLASASYLCSDNSALTSDAKTIDLGDKKNVNGLLIGLAEVEERSAKKRIMARVLVDAQLIMIVNNSSAQSGLFSDGTSYSISVVNITSDGINVKVGSTGKLMEIGETTKLDEKYISILDYTGTYPEGFNVSFMIGKDESYLANWETTNEIFKINSKNYLISLMSASNDNAIIKVSKCQNASMEIKELFSNNSANLNQSSNETADVNVTEMDNSTIINDTKNIDSNDTEELNLNESLNVSDADRSGNESINANQKIESFLKIGTYVGSTLTLIVIFFIIFKYIQKKREVNTEVGEIKISS